MGTLGVGDAASATLTVTPRPGLTGTVANTATAGANALDPTPDDNTSTVTGPITAQADLAITITGPARVDAGGSAVFHLIFNNIGPSDATNVVITDTLPAGLTPHAPPGCSVSGQTFTCRLDSLPAGTIGSIDMTACVDPAAASGIVFEQTATIAADQTDVDPANNSSSVSSTVVRATDVGVTVTADTSTVAAGGVASFTVTVTNHGPLTATAVTLTNDLPAQVTDPRDPPACTFTGNTARCALGAMAVGASTTIRFRGTVPPGTPAGTGLTDATTVTHDKTDSVAANNRDTASMTGVATPPPATAPGGGGSLSFTGANVLTPLQAALLLIALGAGLAFIGRSRRRSAAQ